MRKATSIDSMSDGVKAFTGILIDLNSGDPRVILIDEPEAFLHPALAFKLGKEIARTATDTGKQIFASTHSPQFLMGILLAGVPVNIVRLTYRSGVATARALGSDDVRALMRDPLLRPANAMSGIFYENVVVTEADADRAFYQEINERLLEQGVGRGIGNAFFVNANGKDSIHRIVAPLRKLGIPTAAVFDIDVLNKASAAAWGLHMLACRFPNPHEYVKKQREAVWKALEASGGDPKAGGGISLLKADQREAAENLLDELDRYGVFVLRNGEIEQWLPSLKIARGNRWLHQIFDALGSDPAAAGYVSPARDDVWAFLDEIAKWFSNPNRRGMAIDETKKEAA